MTMKYTAARPDENLDALQQLEDEWTRPDVEPDTVLVVARVNRYGIGKTHGGGSDWQATAGFVHVELLGGPLEEAGEKLLKQAYLDRTGKDQLPVDFSGGEDE